jgi:hypothetical protein
MLPHVATADKNETTHAKWKAAHPALDSQGIQYTDPQKNPPLPCYKRITHRGGSSFPMTFLTLGIGDSGAISILVSSTPEECGIAWCV